MSNMKFNIFLVLLLIIVVKLISVQSLRCRTREHMKQQQDFYNLATYCMKSSMNLTQPIGENNGEPRNHRFPSRQQNRNRYDDYHDTRQQQQHNNRYGHNKVNFGDSTGSYLANDPNMCAAYMNNQNYNNNDNKNYKEDLNYSGSFRKRDTESMHKYNRKNTTSSKTKSPLEEIGACIIHCIFKEMNMLNSDSKVDRRAMENVMSRYIQDSELREFIQDSIEECFDVLESGYELEEQCNFSKKIILCLEEKTKRNCEDWELPQNTTFTSNFNFSNKNEDRNTQNNQNGYLKNSLNRFPNFNTRNVKT